MDWTPDQWNSILWTDETWVTGDNHSKTYVTRRSGEELDPTCAVDKIPKKQGWIFWAVSQGLWAKAQAFSGRKNLGLLVKKPTIDTLYRSYMAGYTCIRSYYWCRTELLVTGLNSRKLSWKNAIYILYFGLHIHLIWIPSSQYGTEWRIIYRGIMVIQKWTTKSFVMQCRRPKTRFLKIYWSH